MTYVFDSGPLIDLFRHYYPARFPSLWERFEKLLLNGTITSTREVRNELAVVDDELSEWCKSNSGFFATPTPSELRIVERILRVPHFQAIVRKKQRLSGRPVADPFVIARAYCIGDSCVVTTEKHTANGAKLPNVCEYFEVEWTDLEGFMERENWRF